MPLRGSILQVETCQNLSLAENPRLNSILNPKIEPNIERIIKPNIEPKIEPNIEPNIDPNNQSISFISDTNQCSSLQYVQD